MGEVQPPLVRLFLKKKLEKRDTFHFGDMFGALATVNKGVAATSAQIVDLTNDLEKVVDGEDDGEDMDADEDVEGDSFKGYD